MNLEKCLSIVNAWNDISNNSENLIWHEMVNNATIIKLSPHFLGIGQNVK